MLISEQAIEAAEKTIQKFFEDSLAVGGVELTREPNSYFVQEAINAATKQLRDELEAERRAKEGVELLLAQQIAASKDTREELQKEVLTLRAEVEDLKRANL